MSKKQGVSMDGFVVWAKKEYDLDPTTKVTVKFILEVLRPDLLIDEPTEEWEHPTNKRKRII